MKKILEAYKIINILSLDVAMGAVISASFFARIFDVVVLPQGLISLGLTVWIIYTADHLLDAKKLKQEASTERHRFHQQHFKLLLLLLLLAILIDSTQIYFIRSIVFLAGLGLAFLVGIYFLVQQRLRFLKELLGTLLYTSGVLLIPVSVKNQLPSTSILLILQFAVTAWINLLLFSWIDQTRDEKDKHQSFATSWGSEVTKDVLIFLFATVMIFSVLQLALFPFNAGATLILVIMNSILLLIFLRKDYFEKEDRYRLLGDAVFLLPLIYLLF